MRFGTLGDGDSSGGSEVESCSRDGNWSSNNWEGPGENAGNCYLGYYHESSIMKLDRSWIPGNKTINNNHITKAQSTNTYTATVISQVEKQVAPDKLIATVVGSFN